MKFKSNIELQAGLEDNNAASGTTGQVLSSTGTGVEWIDQSALTDVQSNFVYFDVKNETGSTINKGKGVMAVGTDGNSGHILIDEMVADGSVEPKYFLGVLETTVANGGFARVISFGQLDQFDTRGQNGETWNDGDILWCDPDSDGDFTITEPDGPNVKIAAAIVLNAATNGKIQVRVQANEGIHDLHDTKIVNQVDGDILVWDNTTGVWFNDSTLNIDQGVGVDITGNLDVSGDVTANSFRTDVNTGDYSVISRSSPGNTTLYVQSAGSETNQPIARFYYGNASPNQGDLVLNVGKDKSYFTNTNVGIGTASPSNKLHVSGDTRLNGLVGINTVPNTKYQLNMQFDNTNADDDFHFAQRIDGNFSGADNTTADREQGGIYIDIDSSADGDAVNEHRIYGIYSDVRFTGFSDVAYGTFNRLESNNSTESTSNMAAAYNYTIHDSSSSGGVSYLYGSLNYGVLDDAGSVINAYGSASIATTGAGRTANAGNLTGALGEVQIDSPNAIAYEDVTGVEAVIDNNEGTNPTGTNTYLFKGSYQGTRYATNAYGIYVQGDKHYLEGNVGIGETNPSGKLHIAPNGYSNYVFTGDSTSGYTTTFHMDNTGLDIGHNSTGRKLNLKTGSLDRLTILGNGNVGIGTTSPEGRFEVQTIDSNRYIRFKAPNGEQRFQFYTGGTGNAAAQYMYNSDGTTRNVQISAGGTSYFNAGNVGIGTTSPSSLLHLESASSPTLQIKDTTNNVTFKAYAQDSNTHLANVSNHDLFIDTNNTARITVKSSGNVGIGTTSPSEKLIVNGSINSEFQSTSFTSGNKRFFADGYAAGNLARFGALSGSSIDPMSLAFYTSNSGSAGGSEKMRITDSGNVGIGETSVDAKLHLTAASSGLINQKFESAGSAAWRLGIPASQTYFAFDNANDNLSAPKVIIDSSGNVGIGLTNPSEKLDVVGNINVSGTGTFGDIVTINRPTGNNGLILATTGTNAPFVKWENSTSAYRVRMNDSDRLSFLNGSDVETVFIDQSGNVEFDGTGTFGGNLDISNNNILIDNNKGFTNSGSWTRNQTPYGYIEFGPANSSWAHIYTDRNNFYFNRNLYVNGNLVWNAGNDGSGSGLDADTLDGQHASAFVNVTGDTMTGDLTVGNGTADNYVRSYHSDGSYTEMRGYGLQFNRGSSYIRPTTDNTKILFLGSNTLQWLTLSIDASTTTFNTNGSENMRITSAGNVGIGTTSPGHLLEIRGTSDALSVGDDSNTQTYMRFANSRTMVGYSGADAVIQGGSGKGIRLNVNNDSFNSGTAMYVNSSGNVGIGTTSPVAKLDVNGHVNASNGYSTNNTSRKYFWRTDNTVSSGTIWKKIGTYNSSGQSSRIMITITGTVSYSGGTKPGKTTILAQVNNNNLLEGTFWTEGMSSQYGNVGFISNSNTSHDIYYQVGSYGEYAYEAIISDGSFTPDSTTVSTPTFTRTATREWNVNQNLIVNSSGNVGIGTTSPSSKFHVAQTISSTINPGVYFEADSGPSVYGGTNVRVDNIDYGGGMSFYRAGTFDSKAIAFINGTTQVGSISINTSSTSYNTTSDYRLKENLTEITDGIERLKQLQPKRFNFIGDTNTVDGFIAHEAKQVVPEAVTGEKDGVLPNGDPIYQGIDQAKLVPLLTAALQEAITKIEQLETRIQTLENK